MKWILMLIVVLLMATSAGCVPFDGGASGWLGGNANAVKLELVFPEVWPVDATGNPVPVNIVIYQINNDTSGWGTDLPFVPTTQLATEATTQPTPSPTP